MNLKPDAYFGRVTAISPDYLKGIGKKGVILDIDDTLSGHNIEVFEDDIRKWIDSVKKAGIKICLLSNNNKIRVDRAAEVLDVKGIGSGNKPLRSGFRAAAGVMGLGYGEICVIGDQLFTDVLGGNRSGMYTILVDPMTEHSSLFFRLKRMLERPVMKKLTRSDGR